MNFAGWLFDQLQRDDEIGELAREVEGEDSFPESGGRAIYEGWFETFPEETQAVFARAWDEFEADA